MAAMFRRVVRRAPDAFAHGVDAAGEIVPLTARRPWFNP